jgi:hypothetical protein
LFTDIIYVGGLVFLPWGLWLVSKGKRNAWTIVLLGGMMVMLAFLERFGNIRTAMTAEPSAARLVALTRSVLHTLVAPLAIVAIWSLCCLIYEQILGRRKWWQTGLWMTLLIIITLECGRIVQFLYAYASTYRGESSFP